MAQIPPNLRIAGLHTNYSIYAEYMRENTLKRFFLGEVNADSLAEDVAGSVIRLDAIVSSVKIEDMQEQFQLRRKHLIRLCDASPIESPSA